LHSRLALADVITRVGGYIELNYTLLNHIVLSQLRYTVQLHNPGDAGGLGRDSAPQRGDFL